MKTNCVNSGSKKSSFFVLFTTLALFASCAYAEKDIVVKKYSAVARKSIDFGVGATPQKINFRFDNATAWLRENGTFQLDAEIKHGWLLCGTYEVGVRFGIGKPACANVSWISKPRYVSKRKQCNNAWMVHHGTDAEADVVGDVDLITCAQLVVKCTGKCK